MGNKTLVLATFDNEASADAAAGALRDSKIAKGAALGALHHKNLGLKSGDRERIGKELEDGKAALGVLAPVAEADAVSMKLAELGGTAEAHQTTDQALEEVQAAAPTQ